MRGHFRVPIIIPSIAKVNAWRQKKFTIIAQRGNVRCRLIWALYVDGHAQNVTIYGIDSGTRRNYNDNALSTGTPFVPEKFVASDKILRLGLQP
jgi:hypothetical protein